MINVRYPKAASFAFIVLGMSVAALPLPASAGGHGGGGGGHMWGGGGMHSGRPHGPPRPPPPLLLDSGATGRAVSSNCFKPVVDAHGTVVAYRRNRACN
jgi:hypothetical protein